MGCFLFGCHPVPRPCEYRPARPCDADSTWTAKVQGVWDTLRSWPKRRGAALTNKINVPLVSFTLSSGLCGFPRFNLHSHSKLASFARYKAAMFNDPDEPRLPFDKAIRIYWKNLIPLAVLPVCLVIGLRFSSETLGTFVPVLFLAACAFAGWPYLSGRAPYVFCMAALGVWVVGGMVAFVELTDENKEFVFFMRRK